MEISTRASSVKLIVSPSTAARITSASPLSDLDVGDGFNEQEGVFWTPAAWAGVIGQAGPTPSRSLLWEAVRL
jgi:hypothetical protein